MTAEPASRVSPRPYIERLLPDATLPRVMLRAAECTLIAGPPFESPSLDIGSGDGSFAAALARGKFDVGADPSRGPLRYSLAFGSYQYLVQSLGDCLPFRDATFASMLSNSTLEHTPDPAAILKEMGRVARPGATCVITVPSENFPRFLLGLPPADACGSPPASACIAGS